jgi:hypothetical protein
MQSVLIEDVTPSFSIPKLFEGTSSEAGLFGKAEKFFASLNAPPKLSCRFLGKFRHSVARAPNNRFRVPKFPGRRIFEAPLLNAISNVVGGRSGEKMGGIHARRIVAYVTDEHPRWDGAMRSLVGHAMSEAALESLSTDVIVVKSISMRTSCRSPQPALRIASTLELRGKSCGIGAGHSGHVFDNTLPSWAIKDFCS